MKKLIIVANDAEGIGKSTCAQACAELFKLHKIDHTVVVTCPLQNHTPGSTYLDVAETPDVSELVQLVEDNDAVVVDLLSGGASDFAEFFNGNEIEELLAELDVDLTVMIPLNDDTVVLEHAVYIAEHFADGANYVVVNTPILADEEEHWDTSYARKVMEHLDATMITMPAIDEAIVEDLEGRGLNPAEALAARFELPRFALNELGNWLGNFEECVEPARDAVFPNVELLEATGSKNYKSSYDRVL